MKSAYSARLPFDRLSALLPLRLERQPTRQLDEGAIGLADVAEGDPSAKQVMMAKASENERALIDAFDEPLLVVEGTVVRAANGSARKLLGKAIEGRDVRLAIRHPQALELILAQRPGAIDVTGIGELERRWRLHIKKLNGSMLIRMIDRSAAIATEKMRVDFVANASHELRTPLTAIIGYSETLAEADKLSDELRLSFAQTIGDEAQRMQRIIQDLMSLSRLEAHRFVRPTESVQIANVIDAAVINTRSIANSRHCEFVTELEGDLPDFPGDFDELVQLVENILSNAVRYGCQGNSCEIRILATPEAGFLRITTADTGPGIAKEHLPRLTERFYRVDSARSRNSGGTGLGLSIVKHIVERHRGTLEISSEVGKGTIVTVRLPTQV